MAKTLRNQYYELAFTILLIINVLVLIYFIAKLNQIADVSRETQAQAQEVLQKLNDQP